MIRHRHLGAWLATLAVVVALAAGTRASLAAPAGFIAGATGYDVSYPQCGSALPGSGGFGIVGVNNGLPWSENPCLQAQYSWAVARGGAALYINSANPAPHSSFYWPASGTSDPAFCQDNTSTTDPGCSYDYGWHGALDSLNRARTTLGTSVTQVTWWIDVEIGNSWNGNGSANAATIQGMADALHSQGIANVGIYSTVFQWTQITGGYTTSSAASYAADWSGAFSPAWPVAAWGNWVAGATTLAQASSNCATTITGGPTLLAQYDANGLDGDLACDTRPSAAPTAASASSSLEASNQANVTVSWQDNSSDETGFRVLRAGGTGSGFSQTGADLPPGTTSFSEGGLTAGSYYAYWIVALRGQQLSYAPTYITVITPLAPARPVPVAAAAISASRVRVQWADSSATEEGFRVLRFIGGSWTDVSGALPPNTTAFVDGDNGSQPLTPGATYAYWVVAFRGTAAEGVSYAPGYLSASTPAAVTVNAPVYASASATGTTATIQWSAAGGTAAVSGYRVLRQGPSGWDVVSGAAPLAPGTLSFTDSGLAPGSYHAYWVVALNGSAETYASSYITVVTSIPPPPSPVSAVGVADGIRLTWTDNASTESGFEIRRFDGASWQVVGTVGANVTSFTDHGPLVAGQTYAYWLTATSGTLVSYASAYIAATAY